MLVKFLDFLINLVSVIVWSLVLYIVLENLIIKGVKYGERLFRLRRNKIN